MPSVDRPPAGSVSVDTLRRIFTDLRNRAETEDWEGMDKLAGEYDRALREALVDPDLGTITYLQTIREEYEKLLDLIVSMRDETRAQLSVLSKGRKAVAAYR